ncbi:hypothetical protein NC652_002870 [Populus alba x Populus x berolinensis]|nr:hypothetical protein NC652_002870 [Populus alba x Populus x berolinensis]
MGKEGLMAAKELKRLQSNPVRLDRFIKSNVSRLLKSDILAVLAEFQRQDQVFLCMKWCQEIAFVLSIGETKGKVLSCWFISKREVVFEWSSTGFEKKMLLSKCVRLASRAASVSILQLYDVVRKEIWYRPDMFFFRDMLMMLARNKKVDEANQVWRDLRREEVLFDQHTFGDIIRAFLDNGLPSKAMDIYEEMRQSPDPPISLPFRVILKGLIPFPELREQVKDDFLELFPDMIVYDPAEDLFEDQERENDREDD